MATLLLQTAVSVGFSLLRNALAPDTTRTIEGQQLEEGQVSFASEGQPIPRLWGRARIGGKVIWATRFLETKTVTRETSGGGKGGPKQTTVTTNFSYSVSMAVAICEGGPVQLGRVWADGNIFDLSTATYRFYPGDETQLPDAFIETVEGIGNVPAYRGLCYIVFENLDLTPFGNRPPQFSFEVTKRPEVVPLGAMESLIEAVAIIPGSGEFVYSTQAVLVSSNPPSASFGGGIAGDTQPANVHSAQGKADFPVALDQLEQALPNVASASLVVSWFGDDLRCGVGSVRPKVELVSGRNAVPEWQVSGVTRAAASVVTADAGGNPVFGGTPSDLSVREAVIELKARGLRVMFYPFILMDIPAGNALTDPYGEAEQAPFPWRGRITIDHPSGFENYVKTTNDPSSASWSDVLGPIIVTGLADPEGGTEAFSIQDGGASFTGVSFAVSRTAHPETKGARSNTSLYVRRNPSATTFILMEVRFSGASHRVDAKYDPSNDAVQIAVVGTATLFSSGLEIIDDDWVRIFVDGEYAPGILGPEVLIFPSEGFSSNFPNSDNTAAATETFAFPQIKLIDPTSPTPFTHNKTTSTIVSSDKTAAVTPQTDAFTGLAAPGDFGVWDGATIPYTGPAEFSFRRMVLHYAKLVSDLLTAGDVFVIGSEMVALTSVRDSAINYPFVDDLVTLAADVSGILGAGRLLTYAADWSEYHSHRPGDGSADVFFNLDPLWASADIDVIGIDNYLPQSDWRDGSDHLDFLAGFPSIYDSGYLQNQIEAGEHYDYFYATAADRDAQIRTVINDTDPANEDFVFRNKDIRNWYISAHHNRPAGVRDVTATAYTPSSKDIYFTEFGVPAVDKGSNQPNVFFDPKSSESAFPHFSRETRDDYIQRRAIEETIKYWAANSPTNTVTVAAAIKPANMFVYTFDGRPYPQFPFRTDVWADGLNWERGHWISGRVGLPTLQDALTEICGEVGFLPSELIFDIGGAETVLRGFVVFSLATPRAMVEMLEEAFLFRSLQSGGKIKFRSLANASPVVLSIDDFAITADSPSGFELTRRQEIQMPAEFKIQSINEAGDYSSQGYGAHRQEGNSRNVESRILNVVLQSSYAQALPYIRMEEIWTGLEHGFIDVAQSKLAIEQGDVITTTIKGRGRTFLVEGVDSGFERRLLVRSFNVLDYESLPFDPTASKTGIVPFYGQPATLFLDLPLVTGEEPSPWSPRVASYMKPWPGGVDVYRDDSAGGFSYNTTVLSPAAMGLLTQPLNSGPESFFDLANVIEVDVFSGDQIVSVTELQMLAGANAVAVLNAAGGWEICQFEIATLITGRTYQLTKLLRGLLGSEGEMRDPVAIGAAVVFLNLSPLAVAEIGISQLFESVNFRTGPASIAVDDPRYVTTAVTIGGIGLRPWSLVHLSGVIESNDNWTLAGVRRARFGQESWSQELPLNEDVESYDLEIMDGAAVTRTVAGLTSPAFTYLAADQVTDFGVVQTTLTVRWYQNSVIFGRGQVREATF